MTDDMTSITRHSKCSGCIHDYKPQEEFTKGQLVVFHHHKHLGIVESKESANIRQYQVRDIVTDIRYFINNEYLLPLTIGSTFTTACDEDINPDGVDEFTVVGFLPTGTISKSGSMFICKGEHHGAVHLMYEDLPVVSELGVVVLPSRKSQYWVFEITSDITAVAYEKNDAVYVMTTIGNVVWWKDNIDFANKLLTHINPPIMPTSIHGGVMEAPPTESSRSKV